MQKIRSVKAARAFRVAQEAEKTALKTQVDEATETMRGIANAFSASIWKVLPQQIKQHFEKFRS